MIDRATFAELRQFLIDGRNAIEDRCASKSDEGKLNREFDRAMALIDYLEIEDGPGQTA